MSGTGILFPKDFNLKTLLLHTATGVIDLKFIMSELSYQEDLFNNVVSGYVMVAESSGYGEFLSLTGSEFLEISFSKGGNVDAQITKIARVYKIEHRKLTENMYTESYCLQFCSEELVLSEQYKISKSYKNMTIDAMISDICTGESGIKTLGISKSKLNITGTYGLYSFIVPTLKPFDAINWLSTYALSNQYSGADMVFYENNHGFNFNSLQYLMGGDGVVYGKYRYDPKNLTSLTKSNMQERMYNVSAYEILNSFDTLNGVNTGTYANRLLSVDLVTRTTKTTDFDYSKYFTDAQTLNNFPIINNYTNRNGDMLNETSAACMKLAFTNFDQNNPANKALSSASVAPTIMPNINAETYIPYRTAQIPLANYTRVRISVAGDPTVTVGKQIEFNLPSNSPNYKGPNLFYSGIYLVTAVRHLITQTEYKTVMEITKDSVPNQYMDNAENSTIWNTLTSQ